MGSNKNKGNPNANHGKYCRRRVPVPKQPPEQPDVVNSENRIINISCLKDDLTSHAATCRACVDDTLQNREMFNFLQETNRAGLASILTSQCAGCQQEFSLSTSNKVKVLVVDCTGRLTWQLFGVR